MPGVLPPALDVAESVSAARETARGMRAAPGHVSRSGGAALNTYFGHPPLRSAAGVPKKMTSFVPAANGCEGRPHWSPYRWPAVEDSHSSQFSVRAKGGWGTPWAVRAGAGCAAACKRNQTPKELRLRGLAGRWRKSGGVCAATCTRSCGRPMIVGPLPPLAAADRGRARRRAATRGSSPTTSPATPPSSPPCRRVHTSHAAQRRTRPSFRSIY